MYLFLHNHTTSLEWSQTLVIFEGLRGYDINNLIKRAILVYSLNHLLPKSGKEYLFCFVWLSFAFNFVCWFLFLFCFDAFRSSKHIFKFTPPPKKKNPGGTDGTPKLNLLPHLEDGITIRSKLAKMVIFICTITLYYNTSQLAYISSTVCCK